jgi:hypothetical protein
VRRDASLAVVLPSRLSPHITTLLATVKRVVYTHPKPGRANDSAFSGATANMRGLLSNVGWRASWTFQRQAFEEEFVEWMDALVAKTPAREPIDPFGQWKAEVSRMRGSGSSPHESEGEPQARDVRRTEGVQRATEDSNL